MTAEMVLVKGRGFNRADGADFWTLQPCFC